MGEQKKRRGRAGKASYFAPDDSGSYVYSGPLYTLQLDSNLTARQASMRRLVFSGIMTLLSLLCGFLPPQGIGNEAYIVLPYAGGLLCILILIWKASRVAYWGGDRLREYVYRTTVKRFPILTFLCALFAGFSIAGEGIRLLSEKSDLVQLPFAIIFLLAQAAILILAVNMHKFEAALVWENQHFVDNITS